MYLWIRPLGIRIEIKPPGKLKAIKKSRKVIKTDPEKIQESAKNNMLKIIIEAFKALGIITDEFSESGSRIFNIIEIEDTQWKMNAKSKNVLISYLIKGFSSLNNISDEDKNLIMRECSRFCVSI